MKTQFITVIFFLLSTFFSIKISAEQIDIKITNIFRDKIFLYSSKEGDKIDIIDKNKIDLSKINIKYIDPAEGMVNVDLDYRNKNIIYNIVDQNDRGKIWFKLSAVQLSHPINSGSCLDRHAAIADDTLVPASSGWGCSNAD